MWILAAGQRTIIGLRRTLGDVDHVGDGVLALGGLAAGLAQRAAGAQTARQLAAQRPARVHVERLVDRLGRHPHLPVVGELAAQAPGDLLGRAATRQIVVHPLAQGHVDCQLGRLGPARALPGLHMGRRCPVATIAAIDVALQLARDRRRRPPQPPGDHPHRLLARCAQRDLLALGERQAAALQIAAAARAHPTGLVHPPAGATAMRASHHGRIGEKPTGLQRSPHRLDRLGDQLVGETDHPQLLTSGTITARQAPQPRDARRSPLRLALRARLRSDQRPPHQPHQTHPRTPSHRTGVAITARTQGTATGTGALDPLRRFMLLIAGRSGRACGRAATRRRRGAESGNERYACPIWAVTRSASRRKRCA